jgi:hypothetical protein
METLIIIMDIGGWGSGKDLSEARKAYRSHNHKDPRKESLIHAFTGTEAELKKIELSDFGTISWPKTLTHIKVQ